MILYKKLETLDLGGMSIGEVVDYLHELENQHAGTTLKVVTDYDYDSFTNVLLQEVEVDDDEYHEWGVLREKKHSLTHRLWEMESAIVDQASQKALRAAEEAKEEIIKSFDSSGIIFFPQGTGLSREHINEMEELHRGTFRYVYGRAAIVPFGVSYSPEKAVDDYENTLRDEFIQQAKDNPTEEYVRVKAELDALLPRFEELDEKFGELRSDF